MIQNATDLTLGIRDVIELVAFVAAGSAVWWKQNAKINGFGARTDQAVVDAAAALKLGDKLVAELNAAHEDRSELRERIASVETVVDTIKEELTEERLAVMTTLHNSERAASDRSAELQKQIAVLTERMDINRIVRTVVSEFKEGK